MNPLHSDQTGSRPIPTEDPDAPTDDATRRERKDDDDYEQSKLDEEDRPPQSTLSSIPTNDPDSSSQSKQTTTTSGVISPLHTIDISDTHKKNDDDHNPPHDEHGGHSSSSSWFKLPSFLQYENLPKPAQDMLDHSEYVLEEIFHCKKRGSSVNKELICGIVQYISCLYVLPVVPEQMEKAGISTTHYCSTIRLLVTS
jgi:hypothetical protein